MKIYFAGSIRGGRDDRELYRSIIGILAQYGTVLTEHIGDESLCSEGEQNTADSFIFERDMRWVAEADIVVAEVTTPSLGVGYEIGRAEAMSKKILCLYRPTDGRQLSAMIAGNPDIVTALYSSPADIPHILEKFLLTLSAKTLRKIID